MFNKSFETTLWRKDDLFGKWFLESRISAQVEVACAFNSGTQEAEAGVSLWVWGQSDLQNKFQDSQSSYTKTATTTKSQTNKYQQQKKSAFHVQKNKLDLYLTPYSRTNLNWSDFHVRNL
jgi:hypothetical protein